MATSKYISNSVYNLPDLTLNLSMAHMEQLPESPIPPNFIWISSLCHLCRDFLLFEAYNATAEHVNLLHIESGYWNNWISSVTINVPKDSGSILLGSAMFNERNRILDLPHETFWPLSLQLRLPVVITLALWGVGFEEWWNGSFFSPERKALVISVTVIMTGLDSC